MEFDYNHALALRLSDGPDEEPEEQEAAITITGDYAGYQPGDVLLVGNQSLCVLEARANILRIRRLRWYDRPWSFLRLCWLYMQEMHYRFLAAEDL